MRPPRLLLLIFCFIFLPILLTFLSLISAEPHRGVNGDVPIAGRSSRLHALFSFNAPASLFPPSAIISLTDDNSTFFLARPAAFGPLLPSKGLNGQLWIGSGFSEDTLRKGVGTAGFQGELGCSDVPGWDKDGQSKTEKSLKETETSTPTSSSPDKESADSHKGPDKSLVTADKNSGPAPNDGTDDHLHHPLPASDPQKSGEKQPSTTHADIQSLQESAEIAGKVVLLSRGGCGFLEKVKWVQRRGGVALIVGDDTRGGSLITMYARGDTSNITIPAVFTSYTTAHLLSSLIPERAMLEGQTEVDSKKLSSEQKQNPTTTTKKAASKPTSTTSARKEVVDKDEPSEVEAKGDNFISFLLSLVGWGEDEGGSRSIMEDSRRPPSSGNIDWVLVNEYDENEEVSKPKATQSSKDKGKKNEKSSKNADNHPVDGDGFEIGVHDWRDPDLVPPKPSKSESSSTAGKNEDSDKKTNKSDSKKDNDLKGGSITPGSGEYTHMIKVPAGSDKTNKYGVERVDSKSSNPQSQSDEKGWFARYFGWNQGVDEELDRIMKSRSQAYSDKKMSTGEEKQTSDDHVGLWVTITPTSMSTSPFFDTLLVLVVSPLITLTVVYALLLLRSRIRRRRWRAPKSVVERLPIRTYHTISSHSTTSSNSPRSPSPGSVTSTSPLLGTRPPGDACGRSRPRSQTVSGAVIHTHDTLSSKEGNVSGSDLWRRKYIGRQVECVVCLEDTPWLTTRRRTCPICKGDVVRSMAQQGPTTATREPPTIIHTAAVPTTPPIVDDASLEDGTNPDVPLLSDNTASSSAPQSSWRNFSSLSFSALNGDTIWHSARSDQNRIKAVAQAEISRLACVTFQALRSGAYLYPFQGIIYLLTHTTLRQPLQARLMPTLTLGIGVTGAMFFLTYVPQMALLALTSGPLVAPISAALLVIRESSAITGFLSSASSSSSSSLDLDAFDATLILKGHERLVASGRELKSAPNRYPNALSRLGRLVGMSNDIKPNQAQSSALNRLIRTLLYLPLNFIPVVGTLIFLALSGQKAGRDALTRYFELKGFTARQRGEWLEAHEGGCIGFGVAAAVLEMVPFASFLFACTNTVGAALWAASVEDGSAVTGSDHGKKSS
ncbi:hypothetical protein UA08_04268 [Talaromyces atroroseus]|uniref:PA domain-containing protein n=1 Tax=Talaromyces atroroseus TaxID=1441469 RepID=A0A1Q5Q8W4_TALAT|nr:hypothetical protein UA08_04268 [Talaromyces atroroseus]OKL60512.1 hypothetical protein UA08_04268 [Talaromyces atroroseus]